VRVTPPKRKSFHFTGEDTQNNMLKSSVEKPQTPKNHRRDSLANEFATDIERANEAANDSLTELMPQKFRTLTK